MDSRMQELVDHHDIRTLLAQYCHACDRADAKLMASLVEKLRGRTTPTSRAAVFGEFQDLAPTFAVD